jgi:hypothetical protein
MMKVNLSRPSPLLPLIVLKVKKRYWYPTKADVLMGNEIYKQNNLLGGYENTKVLTLDIDVKT